MTNEELIQRYNKLYLYVCNHPDAILRFYDESGDAFEVTFDTAYETDNNLELDDPDYEEFYAMAFCKKSTGKLFEISYHNLPAEVWFDNERVI